jgi:imidazolonepropionase-like amidohydrolase
VPKAARVVDATAKFVTPGFIDTNVHLSLYNNGESMVRYEDRFLDLIAEAAQTELKYGITTVRDSYGALLPLITGARPTRTTSSPSRRVSRKRSSTRCTNAG